MINCKIRTKIEISTTFVAFLCFYYYLNPAGTFFPFILSITFHELGHILALYLLGEKIHMFKMHASGASIMTEPLGYKKELLAAASGPAMNLLLFVLTANAFPKTALVNLCLFSYNTLPIYPLDGGRILHSALFLCLPMRAAVFIQRLIADLCLCTLLCFAIYLTCVWHCGLWPILVFAVIILRTTEAISPKRRKNAL